MIVRLDPVACRALLGQASVGRVAASMGALPEIRTVRFTYSEDEVVFKVPPESRLRRAVRDAVVAFSADHCDDAARSGWSVVVQGVCGEIEDSERLAVLRGLPLPSWAAGGGDDVFMSIPVERMNGHTVTW